MHLRGGIGVLELGARSFEAQMAEGRKPEG